MALAFPFDDAAEYLVDGITLAASDGGQKPQAPDKLDEARASWFLTSAALRWFGNWCRNFKPWSRCQSGAPAALLFMPSCQFFSIAVEAIAVPLAIKFLDTFRLSPAFELEPRLINLPVLRPGFRPRYRPYIERAVCGRQVVNISPPTCALDLRSAALALRCCAWVVVAG